MSDDPITRKDLIEMEERLFKRIDKRFESIDERFETLDLKIEKVETTLLTEFHKWASPIESRMRTHRSWFSEVDAELELLKDRVRKLEARNN